MEKELVRVGYILDVEQFDMGIAFRVEGLVHVLQHLFHIYLLGISYAPYGIERQTFAHSRLKDEDGSGSRAGDEIDAVGAQLRYRLGKDSVIP